MKKRKGNTTGRYLLGTTLVSLKPKGTYVGKPLQKPLQKSGNTSDPVSTPMPGCTARKQVENSFCECCGTLISPEDQNC